MFYFTKLQCVKNRIIRDINEVSSDIRRTTWFFCAKLWIALPLLKLLTGESALSLFRRVALKTFGIIKTSAMHPVDRLNSLMHTTTPTTTTAARANRISRPSKW